MNSPENPLVSVVIPTFRRLGYLQRAVVSVQAQTWDNWEIIVTDDDTDGDVAAWLETLGDRRIRYVAHQRSKEFGGPDAESRAMTGYTAFTANFHFGSMYARGQYIVKLDDDDLLCPEFLEACATFLDRFSHASSVYTAHEEFSSEPITGVPRFDKGYFAVRGNIAAGDDYIRAVLTNRGGFPQNHKTIAFYRRSIGEKLKFYTHAPEDFAFSVALALHGDVGYIPQILYRWRTHPSNNTKLVSKISVWRGSTLALNALKSMPMDGTESMSPDDWQYCITKCERKLPFFYFLSTLETGSWSEVKDFRNALAPALRGKKGAQGIVTLLVALRLIGGKSLLGLVMKLYKRSVNFFGRFDQAKARKRRKAKRL